MSKNLCIICFEPVTTKTGLQCKDACRAWVHYKCLDHTHGGGRVVHEEFSWTNVSSPGTKPLNCVDLGTQAFSSNSDLQNRIDQSTSASSVLAKILPDSLANLVAPPLPKCAAECQSNPYQGVSAQNSNQGSLTRAGASGGAPFAKKDSPKNLGGYGPGSPSALNDKHSSEKNTSAPASKKDSLTKPGECRRAAQRKQNSDEKITSAPISKRNSPMNVPRPGSTSPGLSPRSSEGSSAGFPNLQAVESALHSCITHMCNTLGLLTSQIIDLMNRIKQGVSGDGDGEGGCDKVSTSSSREEDSSKHSLQKSADAQCLALKIICFHSFHGFHECD